MEKARGGLLRYADILTVVKVQCFLKTVACKYEAMMGPKVLVGLKARGDL